MLYIETKTEFQKFEASLYSQKFEHLFLICESRMRYTVYLFSHTRVCTRPLKSVQYTDLYIERIIAPFATRCDIFFSHTLHLLREYNIDLKEAAIPPIAKANISSHEKVKIQILIIKILTKQCLISLKNFTI